jgi:hypothetical protein
MGDYFRLHQHRVANMLDDAIANYGVCIHCREKTYVKNVSLCSHHQQPTHTYLTFTVGNGTYDDNYDEKNDVVLVEIGTTHILTYEDIVDTIVKEHYHEYGDYNDDLTFLEEIKTADRFIKF